MLALVPMGVLLAGGSPIDLDGTLLVQLGIFFVAFFILKGLVFSPVMKVIDARDAAIGGAREEAASMEAEIAEKKADFESQLRQVKGEAGLQRDTQRAEAQKLARELTDRARKQSAEALNSAKAELDLEAKHARSAAEAQVPTLAREITEKLLRRGIH
ncbi:MAG: ATP synthase F0 subunit B [Myxococcales bacterium]|nr:ATP synthase F0 subunit B [Myxococcales bacterium]